MTAYFIRRFLLVVPTFVGITVLIFVITRFVPGGPIERIIAQAQQQALEGGGAAVYSAGTAMTNCDFSGNGADQGGGMFMFSTEPSTLSGCSFRARCNGG